MDVNFSVWDQGTLVVDYQLELDEDKIQRVATDASSVWDEYTVLVEWEGDNRIIIEPFTYSSNHLDGMLNG